MALKTMKAAPRHKGTASGIAKLTSVRSPEYPTFPILMQEPVDVVGILASRSGVAAATVRAQLAAWQIGGGR